MKRIFLLVIIVAVAAACKKKEPPLPPPPPPPVFSPDCEVAGVKFGFVELPAGDFLMGSDAANDPQHQPDEIIHRVALDTFYINPYEITRKQWNAVMGTSSKDSKDDDLPVIEVSWNEVQTFIKKLNESTGKDYRLPTEAEWEYACRATTTTPYNVGDNLTDKDANFGGKGKDDKLVVGGSYKPNKWGLYDMHGNVSEFCSDFYDKYDTVNNRNPKGPDTGVFHVVRGGNYLNPVAHCRSAFRGSRVKPDSKNKATGFRLVLSKPKK